MSLEQHLSNHTAHARSTYFYRMQWSPTDKVPATQTGELLKRSSLSVSIPFLLYPLLSILTNSHMTRQSRHCHFHPAAMKLAAFSVLFALVASVVALPADSASRLVRRQDDCTAWQQYCDTTEDSSACKSENCDDMVRWLLLMIAYRYVSLTLVLVRSMMGLEPCA